MAKVLVTGIAGFLGSHLAYRLSVFSPTLITRNIYQGAVATATAAINAGVKRFVFMSSMARYGRQPITPFTEDMIPFPVDPYGIAKLAAEQTLLALGRAHGMEVVILVPHNIVGERQRYVDPFRNVVSIMVNLMLQGREPIIYGDGTQKRVFSYVGDCIEPMIQAGFQEGLHEEIINIGPDEHPITINELAILIAAGMGLTSPKPIYVPARPCEVKEAWCGADKARELLGYQTKTTLEQMIRSVIAWVILHGPKPFEYHIPIEIQSEKCPKTWKEKMF